LDSIVRSAPSFPRRPQVRPARATVACVLAAAALALAPRLALAAEPASAGPAPMGHLGFVGELALELGGDNVARVYFTNGSSQDVKAGQGGTLAIGGHYRAATAPLDLVATLGYKFVTTAASNSSIGITRAVIQVVGLYDPNGEWFFGGGPVAHVGTTFDGGGLTPDVSFDPSLGLTLQAGWKWIALTGTLMTYKANGASVDASAIGLSLRWRG
jgi:hypothetical protein